MNISSKIKNKNILRMQPVISPERLQEEIPVSTDVYEHIFESRTVVKNIIHRKDKRLLVIIGPCSVHDRLATLEYAKLLSEIQKEFSNTFFFVMRLYFEKPRTTLGWRGLIVEPELDGFIDIERGLRYSRTVAADIATMYLPIATEFLDPVVPQYLSDLVTWASIGARSSESQIHRELASGLSVPVGFKNATDGSIDSAIDAICSAQSAHAFLGITEQGESAIMHTSGNKDCHLVLRGGNHSTNYDHEHIESALYELRKKNLNPSILVDCSHGNSKKSAINQLYVFNSVLETLLSNTEISPAICGFMLESFLQTGKVSVEDCKKKNNFGLSITDECLGWNETYTLLKNAHTKLCEVQYE
ncbi:MAG: 3-deoxy-7-phosphoheptulonate synthase [Spirochaetaceae bacterium]|nr:3-deoxy-7-phosphoheptulonate synthase [Spirochaetaceae bacterium]